MMQSRSFSLLRVLCHDDGVARAKNGQRSTLAFRDWAAQRGVDYPKLEIAEFKGGLRGTRAREPVHEGERIVRLPRTSALVLDPTTKSPEQCPQEVWNRQPWYCKLALLLMLERAKGSESHFSGYLTTLPQETDLPCFWSDEELDQIGYPSVITSIKGQRDEWMKLVNDLETHAPALRLQKDMFLSSLAIVRSRSFSGPYIGSKLADRLRLGAIVIAMAAGNIVFTGIDSFEKTLNAVVAVAAFNLLYEFLLSRRLKVYLLAPGVDLMNHSCHVECDLSYDYFQDGYSVRLDRDYGTGDQVFVSYGKRSNDELLQYYGFVESGNPYDSVRIENGMSKLFDIFRSTCNGGLDVEVPSDAIVVDREGFNASVLEALRSWIKEAGAPATVIHDVLKQFCRQEMAVLRVHPATLKSERLTLIEQYKKEKLSILTKCIELISQLKI